MPQFKLPKSLQGMCAGCRRTSKLTPCVDCLNAAYCSKQCQREHLLTHKPECDRVHLDLSTFYPVIAWIAEFSRLQWKEDWHPALLHHIDQAPLNARRDSEILPDGSEACLINLGMEMRKLVATTPTTDDPSKPTRKEFQFYKWVNSSPPPPPGGTILYKWWHGGPTVLDRAYLRRRISREGHLLPLLVGTGISLLLELFSTAVDTHSTCLHYRGKPIYDFGIYHGDIHVNAHRTFAYFEPIYDDGHMKPERFQDPHNHFWLYFQTEDNQEGEGEEMFLDLGLFVYGYRTQIINADYYLSLDDLLTAKKSISKLMDVPAEHSRFIDPCTPAIFCDKTSLKKTYVRGYHEKNKFSLLRNEELLAGLSEMSRVSGQPCWKFTHKSVDALGDFLAKADKDAGTLKELYREMDILSKTILNGTRIVKHVLDDETWRHFPEPLIDLSRWELDTTTTTTTTTTKRKAARFVA